MLLRLCKKSREIKKAKNSLARNKIKWAFGKNGGTNQLTSTSCHSYKILWGTIFQKKLDTTYSILHDLNEQQKSVFGQVCNIDNHCPP